jgi:hypothetical protein
VLRDYVKTLIGNFRGIEPHQLPKAPSRRWMSTLQRGDSAQTS